MTEFLRLLAFIAPFLIAGAIFQIMLQVTPRFVSLIVATLASLYFLYWIPVIVATYIKGRAAYDVEIAILHQLQSNYRNLIMQHGGDYDTLPETK